jgi:pimeloyl-ACP methyl ester carboxylesterase
MTASLPATIQALFLPGIILPAALRYARLFEALGSEVNAIAKELEVYASDRPPDGYDISMEVEGISRAADAAGFDRFHLYGHSAGGAIALAYAATYPRRLQSLALDEPASDFSDEDRRFFAAEIAPLSTLPAADQLSAF